MPSVGGSGGGSVRSGNPVLHQLQPPERNGDPTLSGQSGDPMAAERSGDPLLPERSGNLVVPERNRDAVLHHLAALQEELGLMESQLLQL